MNTKKLFGFGILAFVGGGAYYFYRQVNLFKQMVVKIVNAKPKSISTSAVEVEFEVQINNISNIDAYITGLNFDIIVENQLVATISKSFDPNKIVDGLRHVIFKPDTITRV